MKRKLLLAALYAVSALGFHANAEDVTSTYLTNPDFEGTYVSIQKPSNDRDIYQPEGWTIKYENGEGNDMTALDSESTSWADNFSNKPQPENGGNKTYWLRFRWGDSENFTIYQQTNKALPAGTYSLSADAYITSGNGTATITAGDKSVTVNAQGVWKNYSILFTLTEEKEITISYSFVQNKQEESIAGIDNFKLEAFTEADESDIKALEDAIEKTKDIDFGFEEGQYAPYNNIEGIKAIAAAKAVLDNEVMTKEAIVAAIEALTSVQWKANSEEVNAIYDGSFANAEVGPATVAEAPADAKGWVAESGALRMIFDATYEKGKPGSQISTATSGKGLFVYNGAYAYGKTDGYTMPLEANTIYELNFKYAGWDSALAERNERGDIQAAVSVSVLNEANQGLAKKDYVGAPHIMDELRESGKILFVTGDAGNYTLKIEGYSGNFVFTDVTLYKAVNPSVEVAVSAAGYATFSSEYALDLSGIEGGKAYIATSKAEEETIKLTEQTGVVAAGTGLVIAAEVGEEESVTVTIPVVAEEGTDLSDVNYLVATDGTEVAAGNYVLASDKDGNDVGFYILNAAKTIEAGKAYLDEEAVSTANSAKALRIVFGDETATAIEAVATEAEADGAIYNVAGQQVGKDYKGIVIKNGKKYLNK